MLFIANAYVMNPATGEEGYQDILIEGSRIVKMGENLYDTMTKNGETEGLQIIDATGLVAAPGLVDVHVHFRDPGFTYKEDIETGAKAALKGGYTTVVLMANTKPVADNAETLAYVLEKGQKTGLHVETCACVTRGMKGQELTDMEQLFREGAAGFTDDGVPVLTEEIVKSAMQEAGRLGVPISFHEENPAFIENNGVNAGAASAHYQIGGSKREAEIDLVRRDLALALNGRLRQHTAHQHEGSGGANQAGKSEGRRYPRRGDASPFYLDRRSRDTVRHTGEDEPASQGGERSYGNH